MLNCEICSPVDPYYLQLDIGVTCDIFEINPALFIDRIMYEVDSSLQRTKS